MSSIEETYRLVLENVGQAAASLTTDHRPRIPIATHREASAREPESGYRDQRSGDVIRAVAFSGGVDSSVVAHAVKTVFPDSAIAMLGVSASLSKEQKQLAVSVARHIGIELRMIETRESSIPEYVANEGMSCYHCKASLYETMTTVHTSLRSENGPFVLYNGTNAEDVADPTRVGLRAADEFHVHSPLKSLRKKDIRALALHMGLPHWNVAAAPCLRSRLQISVPATDANLARIEEAERRMVRLFSVPPTGNFRVRHMVDDVAMLEADEELLELLDIERSRPILVELGFREVKKRPFISGSASRPPES